MDNYYTNIYLKSTDRPTPSDLKKSISNERIAESIRDFNPEEITVEEINQERINLWYQVIHMKKYTKY